MSKHTKAIREALAAGPIPGPWRVVQQKGCCADEIVTDHPDWQEKPNGNFVAEVSLAAGHEKHGQRFEQTAALIAACDPENIAALLAERDALLWSLRLFLRAGYGNSTDFYLQLDALTQARELIREADED